MKIANWGFVPACTWWELVFFTSHSLNGRKQVFRLNACNHTLQKGAKQTGLVDLSLTFTVRSFEPIFHNSQTQGNFSHIPSKDLSMLGSNFSTPTSSYVAVQLHSSPSKVVLVPMGHLRVADQPRIDVWYTSAG